MTDEVLDDMVCRFLINCYPCYHFSYHCYPFVIIVIILLSLCYHCYPFVIIMLSFVLSLLSLCYRLLSLLSLCYHFCFHCYHFLLSLLSLCYHLCYHCYHYVITCYHCYHYVVTCYHCYHYVIRGPFGDILRTSKEFLSTF